MNDLKQLIDELSKREVSRKQFLVLAGGSFLGMIGLFRVMQSLSTPDLAKSDRGVFGEREYGRPGSGAIVETKSFSEDVFG